MAIGTNPFNQAVIFAGLGDKERALAAMEHSAAAGPFRIGRQLTVAGIGFDPQRWHEGSSEEDRLAGVAGLQKK